MTGNDYLQLFWNEINQATEEYIEKGLPELLMEDFEIFFVNGNRLTYENKYFGRRKYLTALGIKVLHEESSENNSKNVELLSEVILSVCNEKFWALPAHVNRETKDELTIDLFAAETAQTLSEMVYLMSDKLPDNIIDRVLAICQIYVENVKDIHINTQIHSTHSGDRQEVYLIQWDVQNDLTMTICDIHIICKSK